MLPKFLIPIDFYVKKEEAKLTYHYQHMLLTGGYFVHDLVQHVAAMNIRDAGRLDK